MKFYLEPKKGKDSKQSVVIRGRDKSGKQFRLFLTSQFKFARVEPAKWNQESQKVKGNPTLNETLTQVKAKLINTVTERQVLNPAYGIPDAWRELYCPQKSTEEETLPQNIVALIPIWRAAKKDFSIGYLRIVDQLKADLVGWNKEATFDKMTIIALEDFKKYLEGKHEHKRMNGPLAGSAVYSRFKYLKVLAKFVRDRGLKVDPAIFDFKYKFGGHEKGGFPLDYEDLMKIWFHRPAQTEEAMVKDVFLMECFSGIRIGDLLRLRCGDVMTDYIEYRDQKNHQKRKRVTLHKFNREIIERHRSSDAGALVFPQLSQQEINVALKSIAQGAGLTKLIRRGDKFHPVHEILSTHCGRKSYATLLAKLGVPGDYVIDELGHSQGSITYGTYVGRDDRHDLIRDKMNALEINPPKDKAEHKLRRAI